MWTSRLFALFQIFMVLDTTICRTIKRNVNSSPNDDYHCSSPLGIARDSINIQVGFTVSSRDDSRPTFDGIGPREQHADDQMTLDTNTLHDRSYIQVEFERPMLVTGYYYTREPKLHFKG
ncbi:uncharacterized protein LOC132721867 isoform X1 [Ruditapes philippinarum]|uniref:uncharacterized protein LOC132721867 isoform X1 n=1 Tax=Ruditapes philippinarum TaxID=129788 RepID=UPI00295B74E2|nr:uncharacterized protein LOC132721867 isoform X1 [Ruditapes philippinarum]